MAGTLSFLGMIAVLLLINRSPNGSDFIAFWSAGRQVWDGQATAAYDMDVLRPLQAPWRHDLPFMNPPPFLLLVAPFALPAYPIGFLLWSVVSVALYFLVVRQVFPRTPWLATIFPPVLICVVSGQNGLVTGALFLGAMLLVDKRPWLAGLLIGAMVIKPQLALLIPIALMAQGRWRAIAGAAISSLGLLAATELVLPGTFQAFLQGFQDNLSQPNETWVRMRHSVHSALVVLGVSPVVALAVQAACAVLMAVLVWRTWRSDADTLTKAAILAAATPLATPYIFDYDLVILVLPIALLARTRPRLALALSLVPIFTRRLSVETGLGLAPLMYAALLWAIWRLRFPLIR